MRGKIEVQYEERPGSGGAGGPRGVFGMLNAAMMIAAAGDSTRAREILRLSATAAVPESGREAVEIGKRLSYLIAEGFSVTVDREAIIRTSRAFGDATTPETRKAAREAMVDAVADFFWAALDGALQHKGEHVILWLALCGKVSAIDQRGFQMDVARYIEKCPGHQVAEWLESQGRGSWCSILSSLFGRAFEGGGVPPSMEIVFDASETDDALLARYGITRADLQGEHRFVRDEKRKIAGHALGVWHAPSKWVIETGIRKNAEAEKEYDAAMAAKKRDDVKPENN